MSESSDVKINLVPQDVIKRREAQRDALVAANVVAAMLLVMLLLISAFAFMIERATSNSFSKKAIIAEHDTGAMMAQHNRLDARIAAFSSRLERIEQISASNYDVNWAQVFEEIRKATPGTVRINTLSSQDGPRLQIEGLAMSNEAIGLFVNLLEKSRSISTVTLLDAHKYNEQSQVIAYQINCKLNTRSAKSKNVG